MNKVIIDNCVVSKCMQNGVCIRSIKLKQKINPNLNINSLPTISYGSKFNDNQVIHQLCDGLLQFNDLHVDAITIQ